MRFYAIPDDWSAEQALSIYEFFNDLGQQIWDQYEPQLYELLYTELDEVDPNQLDLFEFNDKIPF